MVNKVDNFSLRSKELFVDDFCQRFPWIGGDLQTLRDTFVKEDLSLNYGERLLIPIPEGPRGFCSSGFLIGFLNKPKDIFLTKGLVLILHGLGGSSNRQGLKRISESLLKDNFCILRLNLRGAYPGRSLASGTYSAMCNSDIYPVIYKIKEIAIKISKTINKPVPLFGVGISLGGTILLNACIHRNKEDIFLDGLACLSSPLDLSICSKSIERPRNRIYQKWLLKRLIKQTIADPFGIREEEKLSLINYKSFRNSDINSIRDFDSLITAPRWGFENEIEYYEKSSPINYLLEDVNKFPSLMFLQSLDDPWVPSESADKLKKNLCNNNDKIKVLITKKGGHNGFHGKKGCWGDLLVKKWINIIYEKLIN